MMTTRIFQRPYRAVLAAVLVYAASGALSIGHAQINTNITADGTLGTRVTPAGSVFNIDGGTIRGGNQFHSFGQFSVGTGNTANFSVANTIQNIISRVTGGVRSQIDGTITSTITGTSTVSSANLFLLNPAGILFGKNAQLNTGGSFHASTGDYVKLGTDGILYADPAKASVLTSAPPSAFGFLTSNPAAIDVQSGTGVFTTRLQVPVGKTLSLVGGTVNVGAPAGQPPAGFVFAPGGVVNIASVASPGEAALAGSINVDGFAQLGEVHITGGAIVDGREINIRSGRLEITDATLFPGISFQARLPGAPAPNGGQVSISVSDDVTITGTGRALIAPPGIQTFAGSTTALVQGDVPGVNIKAGSLSMSGTAGIVTNRFGPGNAPNVVIAADNIEVRNGASIGMTNSFGGGTFPTGGGTLTINGNNMTLSSDGSSRATGIIIVSNFHPAYGGSPTAFSPFFQFADSAAVTINLKGNLAVLQNAQITTDSFAFGRSGAINISAANMQLVGAGPETGRIAAQSGLAGESGSVTLKATGNIDVQNGFLVSANTFGSGNGGIVDVSVGGAVTLTGANSRILSGTSQLPDQQLNSFAQRFSGFFQATRGTPIPDYATLRRVLQVAPAPGDLMQVLAKLNQITSGGNPLVALTDFTPGDAGRISITTPSLTMNADTRIETSTGWNGNAGAIAANVNSLFLNDGASIRNRSGIELLTGGAAIGTGNAGTVNITATDTISVSGHSPSSGAGSAITTSTLGNGDAGNISLTANQVSVQDGGSVSSASGGLVSGQLFVGSGNAGEIAVSTPTLTMANGGTISVATSGPGNAGSILLNTNNFSLTGGSQVVSSTSGAGQGGSVSANASESGLISGQGTGLFSTTSGTGNAGQINVSTPTLAVGDGATISVATSGAGNAGNIALNVTNFTQTDGARVDSSTSGSGLGGDVTVTAANAATISDLGTGLFTTASGTGAGGNIAIQAGQLVQVTNGATISAQSTGTATATAGNISISTPTFEAQNGSVTTGATLADGGNISINTTGSLVHLTDSQITTSVQSGVGSGGNITINSDLIVMDDSQILANAFGGPGGNINIAADVFLVNSGGFSPTSLAGIVDASSALSTPGTVNIEATFTNVVGSVAQLPSTPLQAAELLPAACAARFTGGKASSLVVGGRDGLPLQPGSLLPSPLYTANDTGTPATGRITSSDQSLRFGLLGSKDRLAKQYSLVPKFKCAL